ncbi:hypothetical protein EW145_g12 [Phellinidium pouzarii]|uniref:Uncharacterized protein n=1 Tax=Phellinidium pouzarii TaxID=167371 RepID=A0A4S4LK26_9AGAM|nr:hypothetical protein EW145_g12 [Phellinidium pouzarii]
MADELVQKLRVPVKFKAKTLDNNGLVEWNKAACNAVKELGKKHPLTADIIASVAALDGQEDWLVEETQQLAHDLLASTESNVETVISVLENNVKPLFLSNPHPQLNLSTGRVLSHPAGGDMASQDYYNDQTWKTHPGVDNIVSWCIRQLPPESYEQVWHLLTPPVMTFLDDYQAPYKLRGVRLVSELLQNVPSVVLKRTGVGQLLMTSLARVLTVLYDALTPRLIRSTVPVTLNLIDMITAPESAERFDQLCILLGESIIGGVWVYATHDEKTLEATMDVLPLILHALGIGSVRYLKALIPQCIYCITPNELRPSLHALEIASLRTLLAVIRECQPRMHRWKGAIIEGVGKFWVARCNKKEKNDDDDVLCDLVSDVFNSLSEACPAVSDNYALWSNFVCQDEYPRLLSTTAADALRNVIPC